MHKPSDATQCSEPRCICCRGYEAVKKYESENGIQVETIELNHEEMLRLKEETGSWFIANRMLVKQYWLDSGNTVFAEAVQKEIDSYKA